MTWTVNLTKPAIFKTRSGPSEFYKVTFEQYEFTVDNNGNCTENCPPEKILERTFNK